MPDKRIVDIKNTIAKRVADLLSKRDVVNLGIGIPTLVSNHIESESEIIFQSENGILGVGPEAEEGKEDPDIFDAGSNHVTSMDGAYYMDSSVCFGLIRNGRIDVTVLGAFQVDEKGNLANWIIPNKIVSGYGGAMDLVTGCPIVIVAMEHTNKGRPKILKNCNLPLTGSNCVNYIVTEYGLMEVTNEGIVLKEIAENSNVNEIQLLTEAELIIPKDIKTMSVLYK